MPGEEATFLPGERILITDPEEAYTMALAGVPLKAEVEPDDFLMVKTAIFDLALPPGDPRIPQLPGKREAAFRLTHNPLLADIQLAATLLDGPRTPAGRAAEGLGRTATKIMPILEAAKTPAHRELFNAARELIRKEYSTEWNGDYPAPFLWGIVIRKLAQQNRWTILPETWDQLAARYVASYDRGLQDRRHAVTMHPALYELRRNLSRRGVYSAIDRFAFPRLR